MSLLLKRKFLTWDTEQKTFLNNVIIVSIVGTIESTEKRIKQMTTATTTQEQMIAEANAAIATIHGQKVTMLIQNSIGCIVVRHITLDSKTNVA
jgi:uncharacterized coiled-coil protein SlyX